MGCGASTATAVAGPSTVKPIVRGVNPSDMSEWLGILQVKVIEAKGLLGLDLGGKSDPFVVISFGPSTFRTNIVHNDCNPVWNQELRVPVFQHSRSWSLVMAVYDHDKITKNDHIGRIELVPGAPDTVDFLSGQRHDLWLDLIAVSGAPAGRLHVELFMHEKMELAKVFWTSMATFFDADGNGVIGRDELAALLQAIGSPITDDEIDEVFAHIDSNRDGDISPKELADIMTATNWKEPIFADFRKCLVCSQTFEQPSDAEVVCHLGMCFEAATPSEAAQKFVTGGFVSEEFAVKGWFGRLSGKVSETDVTQSPEFVLVMDRISGKVAQEFIPASIKVALRALYRTAVGSAAARTMRVKRMLRNMTMQYGIKYTHPKSREEIPKFIALHKLNTEEILDPLDSFQNFNEFFYRKLKPGARPIAAPDDPDVVVSAADCRSVVFPTVSDATRIWIKGSQFSLRSFIGNEALAAKYEGGALAIFRLAPQDYHRIHVPIDCVVGPSVMLGSEYFTVNPMAIRHPKFDVYTDNKRMVTQLMSPLYGTVLYVAVGATMVGSIVQTCKEGDSLRKGDEFGYFAFGGSTVVVLFEPNTIVFDTDLVANSVKPLETLIQMGQTLGRRAASVPQSSPTTPLRISRSLSGVTPLPPPAGTAEPAAAASATESAPAPAPSTAAATPAAAAPASPAAAVTAAPADATAAGAASPVSPLETRTTSRGGGPPPDRL